MTNLLLGVVIVLIIYTNWKIRKVSVVLLEQIYSASEHNARMTETGIQGIFDVFEKVYGSKSSDKT